MTDKKIDALRNGQTLKFSETNWVERSGDGKLLRFCRQEGSKVTVYRTCKFDGSPRGSK